MDCICLSFYFSAVKRDDWSAWFWRFAERYSESFHQPLNAYTFTTYDFHRGDAKSEAQLARELAAGHIMSLALSSGDTENEPFALSIDDFRHTLAYGHVYLQIDAAKFPGCEVRNDFIAVLIKDLSEALQIDYGLVDRMPLVARPRPYFCSSSIATVSDAREHNFHEWDAKAAYFQNTIRAHTWGMLISDGHWTGERDVLLGALSLSGAEARAIGDNSIFISHPGEIVAWEDADIAKTAAVLADFGVRTVDDYEVDEDTRFVMAHRPHIERKPEEEEDEFAEYAKDEPTAGEDEDESEGIRILSLEGFFTGNRDDTSIAGDMLDHPGIERFQGAFYAMRQRPDVAVVLIQAAPTDIGEGFSPWIAEWIYVVSSLDREAIFDCLDEMPPDEIELGFPNGEPVNFPKPPPGMQVYALWWN
ncbi:MAG: hypothetical protein ACI8W8_005084 [Rhodothermales bacterium]|jgi:hypothetical protein